MLSLPADGVRLRQCLQEAELSVPQLERRISEECERSGFDPNYNTVTATQIYDMLAERHPFKEATYRSVARALGRDDHLSFTRRVGCVYHLENPEEHNARIELIRLLHIGAIPRCEECLFRYVLFGVAAESLPGALLNFEVTSQGWRRVIESLCPAGLVEIRNGKYVFVEPSTESAIRCTKIRLWNLIHCNRLLFDSTTSGEPQRRVIASHLRPIIVRMKTTDSIEAYCDCDADAQLVLAGGDHTLYRHLLIDIQSLRCVTDLLNVKRRDMPHLQFEGDFKLTYDAWCQRRMDENTLRFEQLMKLYACDETSEGDAEAKLCEIVEPTIANLKALDNAMEARRGTRSDARRFRDVTWPAVSAEDPVPDRSRPERKARGDRSPRENKPVSQNPKG